MHTYMHTYYKIVEMKQKQLNRYVVDHIILAHMPRHVLRPALVNYCHDSRTQ